jgi:hypothetical protein
MFEKLGGIVEHHRISTFARLPSPEPLVGSDQTQQSTLRDNAAVAKSCYAVAMQHRLFMVAAALMFALSALFVVRSPLHDRKVEAPRAACIDRPAVGVVPAEYTCETP